MAEDVAFQALMERLRSGEPDAARQIFHRFERRLIALARSRMSAPIRQKLDPEDLAQSVFKSFFRRQSREPADLNSWDGLWTLLTVITLRKCGFRARHYRAQRRDLQREEVLQPGPEDSQASYEAIAREPTPLEAVLLQETVTELLAGLGERDRRSVELSLQGYTVAEVAAQVQCAERTVQRLLARIKKRLEHLGDDETDASNESATD